MTITHYPKTKEELNDIYHNAVEEHAKDDDWDFAISALGCPRSMSRNPAPEGQEKVIDRDGHVNLDPCRMIIWGNLKKTQIEVPLSIYEDWMDDELIRYELDPPTWNPPQ